MQRASRSDTKRFTRKLSVEGLEARRVLASIPLPGNWDGETFGTLATYDPTQGTFTVPADEDAGAPEVTYRFGPRNSRMTPLFGDWDGDGTPTAGLYSPPTGKFFLKNTLDTKSADVIFEFGPEDKKWSPFGGDWDGDGVDGVGLYAPTTGKFFLKNEASTGKADSKFQFGTVDPDWRPVSGDWNEDEKDNVGIFNADSGEAVLREGDALSAPPSNVVSFQTLELIWQPLMTTPLPNTGSISPLEYEEVEANLGDSPRVSLTESAEGVVPKDGEPFPPPVTIELSEAEAASLMALIAEQQADTSAQAAEDETAIDETAVEETAVEETTTEETNVEETEVEVAEEADEAAVENLEKDDAASAAEVEADTAAIVSEEEEAKDEEDEPENAE